MSIPRNSLKFDLPHSLISLIPLRIRFNDHFEVDACHEKSLKCEKSKRATQELVALRLKVSQSEVLQSGSDKDITFSIDVLYLST